MNTEVEIKSDDVDTIAGYYLTGGKELFQIQRTHQL